MKIKNLAGLTTISARFATGFLGSGSWFCAGLWAEIGGIHTGASSILATFACNTLQQSAYGRPLACLFDHIGALIEVAARNGALQLWHGQFSCLPVWSLIETFLTLFLGFIAEHLPWIFTALFTSTPVGDCLVKLLFTAGHLGS